MKNTHQFHSAESAMSFIQAGNAIFTARSKKTQTRFTYHVQENENGRLFFVSVLTGSDNEHAYSYLGVIQDGVFRRTAKSKIAADAPSFVAFAWLYKQLGRGRLPEQLEIWHEGRCGRCGRTLTVPESIASGYGPECVKRTKVHSEAESLLPAA